MYYCYLCSNLLSEVLEKISTVRFAVVEIYFLGKLREAMRARSFCAIRGVKGSLHIVQFLRSQKFEGSGYA